MRLGRLGGAVAAAACCGGAGAGPEDRGLVVVHDSGRTVAAAPHLPGRIEADGKTLAAAVAEAKRRLAGERLRLPRAGLVHAGPMRGAAPVRLRRPGVHRPVFAFGAGQLQWLEGVAEELRALDAQGFVVSARTPADVGTATAVSRELGLPDPVPVSGEAFMRMYGASTYPVIVEGDGR